MKNGTECHLCHGLFWPGNRGAVKYDRRKQSKLKRAPHVGNGHTVCQAGQWLKFFGTETGERRQELPEYLQTGQGIPSHS